MTSTVSLLTITLNGSEWLRKSYQQHCNWPGLLRWVFVESADIAFAESNRSSVTSGGLSTDTTGEILSEFAEKNPLVTYVPLGWSTGPERNSGKVQMKQEALRIISLDRPDYFIVADDDEFYSWDDQRKIIKCMEAKPDYDAFTFVKREIWRPPAYQAQSLFSYEVVGGFWGIPCCHTFRWSPGVQFRDCHNTPQRADGTFLNDRLYDYRDDPNAPQMVHLGYASSRESREAKRRYYEHRGEATDPQRRWYTESRAAWMGWRLGRPERACRLPHGARVIPYEGPVPEYFHENGKEG